MKRLLIVAHHYPPDAAVGAIRPAKFAKYLPQFGWQPHILTLRESYYGTVDQRQADGAVPVSRTRYFRNPNHYYRAVKRMVVGDRAGEPASSSQQAAHGPPPKLGLVDWINALIVFPDEHAGWIPFALIKASRLVRDSNIDCVFTTGPPHSTHLVGAWLSSRHAIPWVADLRDPIHLGQSPWQIKQAERAERALMETASRVLTTTRRLALVLEAAYPAQSHKVRTITNGFDPDDYSDTPFPKNGKFVVSYLGSLYLNRDPEPLLRALSTHVGSGAISRAKVLVRFIGDCQNASGKSMSSLIRELGLDGLVQIEPWVSKREAFDTIQQSYVLLLLAENQALMIPAKVFDYIGSGRRILALTEDGATADLLRDVPSAEVVHPANHAQLSATLLKLYNEYLTDVMLPSSGRALAVEKFSRLRLASTLADVISEVTDATGQSQSLDAKG